MPSIVFLDKTRPWLIQSSHCEQFVFPIEKLANYRDLEIIKRVEKVLFLVRLLQFFLGKIRVLVHFQLLFFNRIRSILKNFIQNYKRINGLQRVPLAILHLARLLSSRHCSGTQLLRLCGYISTSAAGRFQLTQLYGISVA